MTAHTKTQHIATEDLFELIAETPALAEDERVFWQACVEKLDAAGQRELARDIRSAEREIQKEEEQHEQRMAEIVGKYETRLKRLAAAHKLENSNADARQAATRGYDPLADDDLFDALKNDSF